MQPRPLRLEIQTQRFAFPEAQPGRIVPVVPHEFGKDFATWLAATLGPLTADGYALSDPTQESYGWSIQVTHGRIATTIGIGLHFGPRIAPAPYGADYWVVFVDTNIELTPFRYTFSRRPRRHAQAIGQVVKDALLREPEITVYQPS